MSGRIAGRRSSAVHIFISYRRKDTQDVAGRLFERLVAHFGRESVFKDVDSIRPGKDFREHLRTATHDCDVVSALIGERWTKASDDAGALRLHDPGDFVRLELEAAFERGVTVVPVLVGDARLPTLDELPPSLAPLVSRQATKLRPDPDFEIDVNRLIRVTDDEMRIARPQREDGTDSASRPHVSRSFACGSVGILGTVVVLAAAVAVWHYQWPAALSPPPRRPDSVAKETLESVQSPPLPAEDEWPLQPAALFEPNWASQNMLRVAVDRSDHCYREAEPVTVSVRTDGECYLYLFYRSADGSLQCIFPTRDQPDNRLAAGATIAVPGSLSPFQISCQSPFGMELFEAIGVENRLESCPMPMLVKDHVAAIGKDSLRAVRTELESMPPRNWTEATALVMTGRNRPRRAPRRVALCVGIAAYGDKDIAPLRVSDKDSQDVADALKTTGRFNRVTVLSNDAATHDRIEAEIVKNLPAQTWPGDTVLIFFSGYGAASADTPSERGGDSDFCLVTYGAAAAGRIPEAEFVHWIRKLDGRRVGVVLDTCYARNEHARTGRYKSIVLPGTKAILMDGFLNRGFARMRAVGQENLMLLAACAPGQTAWEMKESDGDNSVLTHFLLEAIKVVGSDDKAHCGIKELYDHSRERVQSYVRQKFDVEQSPQLIDDAENSILIRE